MQQLFNFNGLTSVTLDMPNLPRGTPSLIPNAAGQALIDTGIYPLAKLLAAGLTVAAIATTTANRPTSNLSAGMPAFDLTLDEAIWRNSANNAWQNASGTEV